MKKLLIALTLATTTGVVNAMPVMNIPNYSTPTHNYSYQNGYNKGKHDAYYNVAKTAVFVGFTVIAGMIIYELGKESRWTTNENGIVYKF